MTKKASILFLSVAILALANPIWAQSVSRDGTPIFPATGTWWSADNGDGRWGVVVEAQAGEATTDGQIAVTVFSYESGNTERQAWYTSADSFSFNPNWREDGMIGEMVLELERSAGGTCLLCQDGANEGRAAASDVPDEATILFLDSENAILTVGDVGHPIVKAQWGDGINDSTVGFWSRLFQLQLEAGTTPEVADGGFAFRVIDVVRPFLDAENVVFEGTPGWDSYSFEARGEMDTITVAGVETEAVEISFQLLANKRENEARLIMNVDNFIADMKLFSFGRYLLEGRTIGSLVPDPSLELDLNANVLLISVPSMGVIGSGPYPFRAFGE